MKNIGITQRIFFAKKFKEKRDCLDQRWIQFLLECQLMPIILPNNPKAVKYLLKKITFHGFLLTGGDDLQKYGGKELLRDQVEHLLIKASVDQKIPLLGICRGMQAIQHFFGQSLCKIHNHVSNDHQIHFLNKKFICNSYHNLGTKTSINCFEVLAKSQDKIIEGIKHKKHDLYGIMWHPERHNPFTNHDKSFITTIFKSI